jgi:molecular chaperone DnaK (HSP70)
MQLHDAPDTRTIRADIGNLELPTETVFALALEIMKEKVLKQASDRGVPFSPLSTLWVLTVPAIWTDKAKSMMRRAACKAGLIANTTSNKLMLALEPECAALQAHVDSQVLADGLRYAILDCGGGTVDTTAYVVDSVSPLSLREIHRATGGGWGSTRIDAALLDVLREIFGNPRCLQQGQMAVFDFLTNVWETAKVRITQELLSDPNYRLNINVSAIIDELLEEDFDLSGAIKNYNARHPKQAEITKFGSRNIRLPCDVINAIFSPAIKHIESHVKSLLTTLPALNYIVIVGGFGSSTVVQNAVSQAVQGSSTKVVTVANTSLAIVMGAVRCGLNPRTIKERRAKITYGVEISSLWTEGVHPPSRKSWHEKLQEFRVDKVRTGGTSVREAGCDAPRQK